MSIPQNMKALVKTAAGYDNMELRQIPVPEIADNEVLIKSEIGPIGSDVRVYKGDPVMCRSLRLPVALGSENAGTIVRVGKSVVGFKEGDRVLSELVYSSCQACYWCHTGQYSRCGKAIILGRGVDGSFAEYYKANSRFLHRIPDGLSIEKAAMTEDLGVCISAFDQYGTFRVEDKVAIFGPGPMGALSLMLAKKAGVGHTVMAGLSSDQSRLDLCTTLGSDLNVCLDKENFEEISKNVTNENGYDVVVLAAGAASAVELALKTIAKNGRLIVIGVPGDDITVPWHLLVQKTITINSTWGASRWQDWEKALNCIATGSIPAEKIITHTFPLESWEESFKAFDSAQACKVMLTI